MKTWLLDKTLNIVVAFVYFIWFCVTKLFSNGDVAALVVGIMLLLLIFVGIPIGLDEWHKSHTCGVIC